MSSIETSDSAKRAQSESIVRSSSTNTGHLPPASIPNNVVPPRIIAVNVPPREKGAPKVKDPDGNCVWFTFIPTKEKLFSVPNFPEKVPTPLQTNGVAIQPAGHMGLGLFATKTFERGDLIFAERPILVVPEQISLLCGEKLARMDPSRDRALMLKDVENVLRHGVDVLMDDDEKKELLSMNNSHLKDGSGPITGIIWTNGFQDSMDIDYAMIGRYSSKINHSCVDNVEQDFDELSFCMKFFATRKINAGEQLFYSYCEQLKSSTERKIALQPYDLVCQCIACVNATHASDTLRKHVVTLVKHLQDRGEELQAQGDLSEDALKPFLSLKERMEKDGLDTHKTYTLLMTTIAGIVGKLKEKPTDTRVLDCKRALEWAISFPQRRLEHGW
ncbi:hypothetical protein CVT24_008630 [Panaeolus cyanescens]|uniref:SET domain-containing protein n=1 Tax=Panaeolus cyanescens TaxID=181874 RepID=A0A409VB93_9AGAR|nr:hypothetical protein CVT24_008630 [Panaeolus cyanescens]